MQTRSGNPALQNGLIYGVILGVIEIALYFLLGIIGLILNFILFLFLVGLAGYRASARTGKVSTGLLAGLLTGLFSSVLASIFPLITALTNVDALRAQFQAQLQQSGSSVYQNFTYTNNVVIAFVVLGLVIIIIGACLLGLGIGAIGGAIGKGRAPLSAVPQYPYPGTMYMPPYPPQGYAPPPQEYSPPPTQEYNTPQQYPPLPQDYMSPPQEYTPPPPPQGNN